MKNREKDSGQNLICIGMFPTAVRACRQGRQNTGNSSGAGDWPPLRNDYSIVAG